MGPMAFNHIQHYQHSDTLSTLPGVNFGSPDMSPLPSPAPTLSPTPLFVSDSFVSKSRERSPIHSVLGSGRVHKLAPGATKASFPINGIDRRWSCECCRRRKIKCDGVRPHCGFCTKRGFACVYVGTKNKLDVVYSSTRRRSPGSSTAKPPPSRGGQSHGTSRSSTSSSIASDHHGHDAAGANTDRGHQLVSPVMWSPRQALVDGGHFDTTPVGEDDDDDDDDEDDDNAEDEDEPPAADLEPDGALDAADDTEESDAGATAALAAAAEAFDVFAANPLPDALLFDADMLRLRRHHQPQPEPRNPSFPPSPAKHTKSAWPPTSSVLATPPLPLIPASSSAGLLAADLLPLPAPLWPDAAAAAGVVGGGGMAGVWPVDGLLLDEHPLFHGPVGYLDLLPLQALLLAGAGAGVPSADTDLFGLAA